MWCTNSVAIADMSVQYRVENYVPGGCLNFSFDNFEDIALESPLLRLELINIKITNEKYFVIMT